MEQSSNNNSKSLVIYDEQVVLARYHNLKKLDKVPETYKKALAKVGETEHTISIYTATHMNEFIKKVGNNIILNNPNFFKFMNEEEQATAIGCEFRWEQIRYQLCKSCHELP